MKTAFQAANKHLGRLHRRRRIPFHDLEVDLPSQHLHLIQTLLYRGSHPEHKLPRLIGCEPYGILL